MSEPAAAALGYYASQSRVTDPGSPGALLADMSGDVADLRDVARGLVIHYRAQRALIAAERLPEIDTRYADAMLSRLHELRAGPLTEPRAPDERLVGCCRDFTVLLVAIARANRLPARARVGFASYFEPGLMIDHVVAEVWDDRAGRWRLIDAQLADDHLDPTDGAGLDPLDLARDRFMVAGEAWRRCRAGTADPDRFLVGSDVEHPQTRGWPYLRHNLVHDLAALNKVEMLLWDGWGLADRPTADDADLALLDRVAGATATPDPDLDELRGLYEEHSQLRVPSTVVSYSPLTGQPRAVTLRS